MPNFERPSTGIIELRSRAYWNAKLGRYAAAATVLAPVWVIGLIGRRHDKRFVFYKRFVFSAAASTLPEPNVWKERLIERVRVMR